MYDFFFFLCWVFVAVHGLSPVPASGGYSAAALGPLIAVASVAERGLWARGLRSRSTWALELRLSSWVHRLICSVARGIFPDQG